MQRVRNVIGGIGNLMFKQAFLWSLFREGVIKDVYVQNYNLWWKRKDEIRQMFGQGVNPLSIAKVALHIRRGDYLKAAQFHTNLLETDYYQRAVKEFPGATFLVFCKDNQGDEIDNADMRWCREELPTLLPNVKLEFHAHGEEHEDLNTMASCEGIIMANSTFSFWAAFLGAGKVVCPRADTWFSDKQKRVEIPEEWKQI